MKILILTFTFFPEMNGVANVVFKHAKGLSDLGYDVEVITSHNEKREIEEINKLGFKLTQFKIGGNWKLNSRYYGEIEKYKQYLYESDADIVMSHCWQIWNTDLLVDTPKKRNTKYVLFSHGISFNEIYNLKTFISYFLWRPYVWFKVPKILKFFDHIVIMSDKEDDNRFYDKKLIKRYNIQYSIIPNFVDLKSSYNLEKKEKNKNRMILSVGNYSHSKNEKDVLLSFEMANIEDCELVIIGNSKNSYYNQLLSYYTKNYKKFEIKNKSVKFLCSLSYNEILNYFYTSDLFIFASRTEYFPTVILEAMLTKTPFVSYDVGCVSELKGGFVVKCKEEMANKITEIFAMKPEDYNKLVEEGRFEVLNKYNFDNVLKKIDSLILNLINNSK